MNRGRTLDKILAIVVGIAIWAYVISVLDPVTTTTIRAVPVELTNTAVMDSSGLAIAGSGEYTVDLVIGGNRSNLNDVKASDFIATADVANLRIGQNYINVEVEGPSHISINEVRTQSIQVYVDSAITEEEPISIIADNAEGRELGSMHLDTSDVTVSGAKSLVDKIVSVTAHIDAKDLVVDQQTSQDLELKPVDKDGNIIVGVKLSQKYVHVETTLYETKEVALNIPFVGEINEYLTLESEEYPTSIIIKGPKSILESIWSIDADPIDRSKVVEDCTVPITVSLPTGIENSKSTDKLVVTYKLKGRVEKTLSITEGNVSFINGGEGLVASLEEDAQLDVSVFEEENENVTKDTILVFIDLTDLEEGEYDLPVTIYAEGSDSLRLVNKDQTLHVVLTAATEE